MTTAGAGSVCVTRGAERRHRLRAGVHPDMTDQNKSNPRRTFLLQAAGLTGAASLLKAANPAGAAAAGAAAAGSAAGPVPAAPPDAASVPYQSLSPDEATFIEALVNVMCPGDAYSPHGGAC